MKTLDISSRHWPICFFHSEPDNIDLINTLYIASMHVNNINVLS